MNCPKCGTKIKRTDLSPICKNCGAHIMYYTQEDDLVEDAKKTELEFARAKVWAAKLKAAFIQGKYPILRTAAWFLSVAALLLPIFNMQITFPWWEYKITVSAIGLYKVISDSFWKLLGAVSDMGALNPIAADLLISFTLLLATALTTLISTAVWLLSFINLKKSAAALKYLGFLEMFLSAANTAVSFFALHYAKDFPFISVKPLFGGLISAAVFGAFTFSNIALLKKGQKINIGEADKKRIEIAKKVRCGEIDLSSLPLPIVKEEKKKKERGERPWQRKIKN